VKPPLPDSANCEALNSSRQLTVTDRLGAIMGERH